MASRSLPTGARLVAAIALLFSCIAMVYVVTAWLPEERLENHEARLLWLFGLVGLLHGWYGLGRRASLEAGSGVFLGIRSAITVFLWIVFILGCWELFDDITERRLVGEDPVEGIFTLIGHMGEIMGLVADPTLIGIFLGTGIFCGVVTRAAARAWD